MVFQGYPAQSERAFPNTFILYSGKVICETAGAHHTLTGKELSAALRAWALGHVHLGWNLGFSFH